MTLNDIRSIAKYYIYFSENPKDLTDKIKLMEFVDKANEQQINYLLLKGYPLEENNVLLQEVSDFNMKITTMALGKTPEELRRIVRVAQASGNADLIIDLYKTMFVRLSAVTGGVIVIASVISLLVWIINKIYRVKLSKAAKVCKQYSGDKKIQCMKKITTDALKTKVSLLQKSKSICSKAKNPEKCKAKIQRQIDNINKRMKE